MVASNKEINWPDAENWINDTRQPADGDLGILAQRINESLQKVTSVLSPLLNFVSEDNSSYQDNYIIHPSHMKSSLNFHASIYENLWDQIFQIRFCVILHSCSQNPYATYVIHRYNLD